MHKLLLCIVFVQMLPIVALCEQLETSLIEPIYRTGINYFNFTCCIYLLLYIKNMPAQMGSVKRIVAT